MKAAVIGQPVSHSLSPAIFKFLRARELSPLEYEAREISPIGLAPFIAQMKEDNEWRGVNVTIPHKEEVLSLLDQVSPDAESLGAVNVVQRKEGALYGFNTDVIGIEKTFHYAGFSVNGKTCLVIGAGGSAKAVLHVLGTCGAKTVFVYNPRSNRGQILVEKFKALFPLTHFYSTQTLSLGTGEEFSLLVNTTPVGMNIIEPDFFEPLAALQIKNDALAFDLIYTPKETLFLKKTKSMGIRGVGGLGMLVDQAIATWELWFGTLRELDHSRDELLQYLNGILKCRENPRPIFLTGFMGVGKSTIAQELCKSTGRRFFDTDRVIESKTHLTIAEIFAQQGEASFRELEKTTVAELCADQGAVIALGGGVLNQTENLDHIKNAGTLIYLSANEDTLNQRLEKGAKSRPLLADLNPVQRRSKIKELLKVRLPIYEKAHFSVGIDDLRPVEAAEKILLAIGRSR